MPSPVYITLDGSDSVLPSTGDSYILTTSGGDQEVTAIDGFGVQDGAEVKIINNGPGDITLVHDGAGSAHPMFLPGDVDRVLGANGQAYWMVRNQGGPHGDGWYNGEDPP